MLHPHAIGVGLSSPPSLLLLACWLRLSWSLKCDTLLEMATCVVTETIWSRFSLHHTLPCHVPSITPADYASCELIDEVDIHPKAPKAFHH